MSAYIVWGLALARSAGTDVDAGVLTRAVAFLQAQLIEAEREYDLQAFMLHALSVIENGRSATAAEQAAFDNLWEHRDQLNAYTRALFALAALYATLPVWRIPLIGLNPKLDQILAAGCLY